MQLFSYKFIKVSSLLSNFVDIYVPLQIEMPQKSIIKL